MSGSLATNPMQHAQIIHHFNTIAGRYDRFKTQKPFYYQAIINAAQHAVSSNDRILDYGCGTGTILNALSPKYAVGYDPSVSMIAVAKKKYPHQKNIRFTHQLQHINEQFDTILMIDVIEHLSSLPTAFYELSQLCKPGGRLIVSYVDVVWEPLLLLLEFLKLKMPEGPHRRISLSDFIAVAQSYQFKSRGIKHIKLFSHFPLSPISILELQYSPHSQLEVKKH